MHIKIPEGVIKSYQIIHMKTGLFFNGYDDFFNKDVSSRGKNTLSKTNSKKYISFKKEDNVILKKAFEGNIVLKNDKEYVRNIIVYEGSEIHNMLSEHYDEYELLPIEDFMVDRV